VLWLLLTATLLVYIGRYTNVDLALADWMFDRTSHSFPWKDTWFASVFVHQWLKYFFIAVGFALLGTAVIEIGFAAHRFDPVVQRKLAVVAAAYILVPLVVSLVKNHSVHYCPWDLERYGGFAPYVRIFEHLPLGFADGHCFPAGHASSALWVAALAVFWLPDRPRAAAYVFAVGLLPGLFLGWVQQMRGAHFLTHTLWSAWIASAVIVVLARYLKLGERPLFRPRHLPR
jgi:membrane-associated PAP2 superfamily phosphatase